MGEIIKKSEGGKLFVEFKVDDYTSKIEKLSKVRNSGTNYMSPVKKARPVYRMSFSVNSARVYSDEASPGRAR